MSELRWDPLDRTWALIASERGLRPTDFLPPPRSVEREGPCPFCLIVSGDGPATRIAERRSQVGGKTDRVLVVANRYPALSVESPSERRAVGPYDQADGVGAHEVVIETTRHEVPLRAQPVEHIAEVFLTWRDRVVDLVKDRRVQHVAVFKNDGPRAGATLEHAHSQVVAAPIRPGRVARQLDAARAHWQLKERCLLCDLMRHELEDASRVLEATAGTQTGGFVAWCPYASRHPFEVWIAPRRHAHHFGLLSTDDARELAQVTKNVLVGLDQALMGADLNLMLSLAPSPTSFTRGHDGLDHLELWWHWHLEVVPRLAQYGGYELGTGVIINPTAPEDAAQHLRSLGS